MRSSPVPPSAVTTGTTPAAALKQSHILRVWLPLAASWLFMAGEMPLVTAFVPRLPDPVVNLAAYGSVVFAISVLIESPVIMLLAASTALSSDWANYARLRRFTYVLAGALTVLHALVAFTPLYDLVVSGLLHAPPEVAAAGRSGLRILTPWTAAIAYRRFHQGVLIRFQHARPVAIGTAVRLLVLLSILTAGVLYQRVPGIVVGSTAVSCAVIAEAAFVGWAVRPILAERVRSAPALPLVSWRELLHFYTPLALTQVLSMLAHPMSAAAINRMPVPLPSLAAWPATYGFVFITRSVGFGYNEVVVALLGEPDAPRQLRRFGYTLGCCTTAALLLLALTPLAHLWFVVISDLEPDLVALSTTALLFGALLPFCAAVQSYYQGVLVQQRRTRGVTEAMAIYLATSCATLMAGIALQRFTGIYCAMAASALGNLMLTLWLAHRVRTLLRPRTAQSPLPA